MFDIVCDYWCQQIHVQNKCNSRTFRLFIYWHYWAKSAFSGDRDTFQQQLLQKQKKRFCSFVCVEDIYLI